MRPHINRKAAYSYAFAGPGYVLILALAVTSLAAAPSGARVSDPIARVAAEAPADLEALTETRTLISLTDALDSAVDAKDWSAARALFADVVRVDMTSLIGGAPSAAPSEALVAAWSSNLTERKTSLHMRSNHQVRLEGDRAVVTSHGYAWNRMENPDDAAADPLWEVWGLYEHSFIRTEDGWRIDGFAFEATHQRGSTWVRDTPGATLDAE